MGTTSVKVKLAIGCLCAAALLAGCEESAQIISLTEEGLDIEGRRIFLRGEMNDYAVMSAYQLNEQEEGTYCTLAPLRADWAPYRFKFADANWSAGSNFGYANPPGILREGSSEVELTPNSRFEELQYYPSRDGVFRFCIIEDGGRYFASVSRADPKSLSMMDSLFMDSKNNRGSIETQKTE